MTQRLSIQAAPLFGTPVAETILASVPVRARQQAGHMDASDLIGVLPKKTLRGGGRAASGPTMLQPTSRRAATLPTISPERRRGRIPSASGGKPQGGTTIISPASSLR